MRRRREDFSALRWISLVLVLMAGTLLVMQLVRYSRLRSNFPLGTIIAGVPVGGLSTQQAADRLVQAYGMPVELRYGTALIQMKPSMAGFKLNLAAMIAAADQQRTARPFWQGFWNYLWNQAPPSSFTPLSAEVNENQLRAYLQNEIASRYDTPPTVSMPVPGSTTFSPGRPGSVLDIERAVLLVSDALKSPTSRSVLLTLGTVDPSRPSFDNLKVMLEQVLVTSGFDGAAEMYLLDLQNGQEMRFAWDNGTIIPADIAFSADSTIKIPVMISVYRRTPEPTPASIVAAMQLMIERSDNDSTDVLMRTLDQNLGPLMLTDDMKALGLSNTFIAGYFAIGSPLLQRFSTPSNSRTDFSADPDVYNQTTATEMGQLLGDIYQCSTTGGGTFEAVWPGEISPEECKAMLNYLFNNNIAVLLQAGVPETTRMGHKHGWAIDPVQGVMRSAGDVAIVFTPGGNYVLSVFVYHPVQLVFDPMNKLYADISRAVYNYYNLTDK
jgi:beta-lactamase class A